MDIISFAKASAAVAKAEDATKVVANPTLAGTEAALEGLQVGDTKYKVEAGGGGFFIVNITDLPPTSASMDKTYTEIESAMSIGPVFGHNESGYGLFYKRAYQQYECDIYKAISTNTIDVIQYTIDNTNTCTYAEGEFTIS